MEAIFSGLERLDDEGGRTTPAEGATGAITAGDPVATGTDIILCDCDYNKQR